MEEEENDLLEEIRANFREFIEKFKKANENTFYYRSMLIECFVKKTFCLNVDLDHLQDFNPEISTKLISLPFRYLPVFEEAAISILESLYPQSLGETQRLEEYNVQVLLTASRQKKSLRQLSADKVYSVISIPGIIVSITSAKPRAVSLIYICQKCKKRTRYSPADEKICTNTNCSSKDLIAIHNEGAYVDTQYMKLQESPEEVPTGEIPRTVLVLCERALVDFVTPGCRVVITGVQGLSSNFATKSTSSLREINTSIIHALGIKIVDASRNFTVTEEEEEMFREFAKSPQVHSRIFKSIAPQISGKYTDDIKKAISCLLFGGTKYVMEDSTCLRGDINILLIGDPSTAKSQFLKFTHKVAPVAVFTSGKGSSAAGLTAAVLKDKKGDFYVEGGAMVLADGGVVCIDEFDKMREQDRIAIHESMEQQTISIAKAGITTQLNSRTSVLAAANPVFGTYDSYKSSAENIDFLPTILSRFDLIFIVKDKRDTKRDLELSTHILKLHAGVTNNGPKKRKNNMDGKKSADAEDDNVSTEFLKKYISYCRKTCFPKLSSEGADLLCNNYVLIRSEASRMQGELQTKQKRGGQGSAVPITVRQLEAIARVSEALAKMQLKTEAGVEHVTEALRLFNVSTVSAKKAGKVTGDLSSLSPEDREEIENVEEFIKSMLPIGTKIVRGKLIEDLVEKRGYSRFSVRNALQLLSLKGNLKNIFQQKYIQRTS